MDSNLGMDSNTEVPDYFSQRSAQEAPIFRINRPLTIAQLRHEINVEGQPCDKLPAGINQLLDEVKTIHPGGAVNNTYEHTEVRDDQTGGRAATHRRQGQIYDEYRKILHKKDKE